MENNLAENIRAFRKARKMTQEQLAEALGMTVGTIHKWERNLSTPEIGLIMDMAELFGVSTDVLLGYEWRSESFTCVLERIKALTQAKRYEEAASEAEKLCWNSFYGMLLTAAQIVFSVAVLTGTYRSRMLRILSRDFAAVRHRTFQRSL